MESEYVWNDEPLDLVKRKSDVSSGSPSTSIACDIKKSEVEKEAPLKQADVYLNEEDGKFYSAALNAANRRKFGKGEYLKEEKEKEGLSKKFVLRVPNIKQEPGDSDTISWQGVSMGIPMRSATTQNSDTNILNLATKSNEDVKPDLKNVQRVINFTTSNNEDSKLNVMNLTVNSSEETKTTRHEKKSKKAVPSSEQHCDSQDELSKLVLQSPNLYSALCLNRTKPETSSDSGNKSTKKLQLPEMPSQDTNNMSVAYLEVFDKLMAEYVKKLSAQGTLDNIENTVEGINLVLNNIAAYEQKVLTALYMKSLLQSSYPHLYPATPVNPFLAAQSLGPMYNPVFNPGFGLALISPSPLLQSGASSDILGCPSPFPGSTFPNLAPPERGSSTPMSPPASSPASVSSSTPSASASATASSNKPGSQEPLLRVRDFQQWRISSDGTPTDVSSSIDESSSPSTSAASSGRSSSVASSQNLNLSPLSSVGASPPLSSKSDSFSRSQLLNFSRSIMEHQKNTGNNSDNSKGQAPGSDSNNQEKKKPHIKKPLNAFMLYMKEMRQQVVSECTLKESAAINQILGRRWHSLSREEQGKYYEKARQERQLHMQLYPAWSARDNYGYGAKKKKRKKERVTVDTGGGLVWVEYSPVVLERQSVKERRAGRGKPRKLVDPKWHALSREEQARYYELARKERQLHMQLYPDWSSRANTTRGKKRKRKQETNDGGNNMKKCRARYGLDQQSQWCKPCRRKKKCIRYMEAGGGGGGDDGNQSDDNLGSCGSVGEGDAHTPVDDDDDGDESMSQSHSLSSPGGLSGLSSLTSPSMILPSPSTSLASPSVSLASPCMSLQSPLTPLEQFECKPPPPLPLPLPLPMYNHHHSPLLGPPLHRHPVGTNPHDINNPLSVNQLTGKCIKTETNSTASSGGSGGPGGPGPSGPSPAQAPSNIIRVT